MQCLLHFAEVYITPYNANATPSHFCFASSNHPAPCLAIKATNAYYTKKVAANKTVLDVPSDLLNTPVPTLSGVRQALLTFLVLLAQH